MRPIKSPTDYWDQILAAVEERGWVLTHVLGTATTPPYSYTIGLSKVGKPDLVMKGIGSQYSDQILSAIASRIHSGSLTGFDGERVEKASSSPLILKSVPHAMKDFYLGALRFAQANQLTLSILQVAWPDESGKFQWEDGFDPWMGELQRLDRTDIDREISARR